MGLVLVTKSKYSILKYTFLVLVLVNQNNTTNNCTYLVTKFVLLSGEEGSHNIITLFSLAEVQPSVSTPLHFRRITYVKIATKNSSITTFTLSATVELDIATSH